MRIHHISLFAEKAFMMNGWCCTYSDRSVDSSSRTQGSRQQHRNPHLIPQPHRPSTNPFGNKTFPTNKGTIDFEGKGLCHSFDFSEGLLNSNGKKAIVLADCFNSGPGITQTGIVSHTLLRSYNSRLRSSLTVLIGKWGQPERTTEKMPRTKDL
jgi:hypothetical protein